jgi:hypothetical protein
LGLTEEKEEEGKEIPCQPLKSATTSSWSSSKDVLRSCASRSKIKIHTFKLSGSFLVDAVPGFVTCGTCFSNLPAYLIKKKKKVCPQFLSQFEPKAWFT